MSTVNNRWAPITAVRGYGMLIDGRRIGLYNQNQMIVQGKTINWGVAYLLIRVSEWEKLQVPTVLQTTPVRINFAAGIPPETATISRAFIRDQMKFDANAIPFYLGTDTRWQDEPPSLTELQELILQLHDWVDKWCVS